MWEKALSNYSLYLGPWWWDIYIIVMEVQAVIKLVRWVSSLFQDLSTLFVKKKKREYVDKATFPYDGIATKQQPRAQPQWVIVFL